MKRNFGESFFSKGLATTFLVVLFSLFTALPSFAHCDSYDGPVIKDALVALKANNVTPVLKWVSQEQEKEIIALFNKTVKLKRGDKEVYSIVEKHFLETLVRLHRETEGEPFTGLKPEGSVTEIIRLADHSLEKGSSVNLTPKLLAHIEAVVNEKYQKALLLSKVKDESVQKGREYVAAYVDYTHTLEGIHAILEHGPAAHSH